MIQSYCYVVYMIHTYRESQRGVSIYNYTYYILYVVIIIYNHAQLTILSPSDFNSIPLIFLHNYKLPVFSQTV